MASDKVLVDSSFLFVLYNRTDPTHRAAKAIVDLYHSNMIVPYVVLTETAYLFNRESGVREVTTFLDALAKGQHQYAITSPNDLHRIRQIMIQYANVRFDFVDCCLMALAERLDITSVCTLDRRHFSIFRPKHCDYLELLP